MAKPMTIISQNANLLSVIRPDDEVRSVRVVLVLLVAIIITPFENSIFRYNYFNPFDPGLTAAVPALHMGHSSGLYVFTSI